MNMDCVIECAEAMGVDGPVDGNLPGLRRVAFLT
jgi:hypothetical protein